jgi:hypothetical protein
MHLEHAILVGGYDVFQANGASFGPLGRTRVRGNVFMLKGGSFGCHVNGEGENGLAEDYRGRIVIVDRGGCTFQQKAELAASLDATALVVIDREKSNDGDGMGTYMSGEGDVPIVTVICNAEAATAIENTLRASPTFVESKTGLKLSASGDYLVEILGGLEAVKALNSPEFEENDEEDEEDGDNEKRVVGHHQVNLKTHHLNPIHSDGLNDFVGIGYVIDELIRNRFSIFPQEPVTIGSSWERIFMVSDMINPDVQAKVTERFRLVSISRAESDFTFGEKGDLIAEIHFSENELPIFEEKERVPVTTQTKDGTKSEATRQHANLIPQFGRPSLRGHSFKTEGVFQVHVKTGLVFSGSSRALSSSEKYVVVENEESHMKSSVKAKVTLRADSKYSGSMN